MIKIVETFRSHANANRLVAALGAAGISARTHSQGEGAVWNVYVRPEDHDAAYQINLGTIYV
jgi:hypothetical protein